jgi:hypothetical protein
MEASRARARARERSLRGDLGTKDSHRTVGLNASRTPVEVSAMWIDAEALRPGDVFERGREAFTVSAVHADGSLRWISTHEGRRLLVHGRERLVLRTTVAPSR